MNANEEYISLLQRDLPDLVEVKHLVKIGIYRHENAAYMARQKGDCPPFMRIPHRGIVYPKKGVIEFLRNASHPTATAPALPTLKPSWQKEKTV